MPVLKFELKLMSLQDELGDVVYVELPDVGSKYEPGESICTVESVKASSAVYAPVGGEVSEVNTSVKDSPEKVLETFKL